MCFSSAKSNLGPREARPSGMPMASQPLPRIRPDQVLSAFKNRVALHLISEICNMLMLGNCASWEVTIWEVREVTIVGGKPSWEAPGWRFVWRTISRIGGSDGIDALRTPSQIGLAAASGEPMKRTHRSARGQPEHWNQRIPADFLDERSHLAICGCCRDEFHACSR